MAIIEDAAPSFTMGEPYKYKLGTQQTPSASRLILLSLENGVTFFNNQRDRSEAIATDYKRSNHFTAEQNKQLADELYECLKQ